MAPIQQPTSGRVRVAINSWPAEALETLQQSRLSSSSDHVVPIAPPAPASASIVQSPTARRVRGTGVTLNIPLDTEHQHVNRSGAAQDTGEGVSLSKDVGAEGIQRISSLRRRSSGELSRRDSLKRREALLKGKEGSRRRQRWENGTLVSDLSGSKWFTDRYDRSPPRQPLHAAPGAPRLGASADSPSPANGALLPRPSLGRPHHVSRCPDSRREGRGCQPL